MTSSISVKGYTRRKASKPDAPVDPLADQFPAARERLAKLRQDIRAANEAAAVPVMDFAPAPDEPKLGIIERFMPWFGRRG